MTGESGLPPDVATRADDLLRTRPNADQLAGMTTHAFEASGLDHDTLMLVWLAALVALDAPTESYLMNLGAASQTAVSVELVHQVLTALAPIVGSARVVSATTRITEVLRPPNATSRAWQDVQAVVGARGRDAPAVVPKREPTGANCPDQGTSATP